MDNHDVINMQTIHNLQLIKPNDVVVDVGANVGNYTYFFATMLQNTGKIYSFELHPHTYIDLKERFKKCPNIEIINKAISDRQDLISYYKGNASETHNILGHDMQFNPNEELGKIQADTLDNLLQDEESIAMIKIDVEGAEPQVLNGMRKIAHKTKSILIENHLDEFWPETKKILIEDFGFSCYNMGTQEAININSPRCYQCLCQKDDI